MQKKTKASYGVYIYMVLMVYMASYGAIYIYIWYLYGSRTAEKQDLHQLDEELTLGAGVFRGFQYVFFGQLNSLGKPSPMVVTNGDLMVI